MGKKKIDKEIFKTLIEDYGIKDPKFPDFYT